MSPVLFTIMAVLLVAAALGVVLHRSPIRSALSLVVTMFLLSVMYLLLDAQMVAALQVVVYAGAVMILFLFVIMLLNLREDVRGMVRAGKVAAAGVGGGLFLFVVARFLLSATGQSVDGGLEGGVPATFGSTELLAERLFTQFLFAFEVTSVLLLVAVVGAVVLAKRKLA